MRSRAWGWMIGVSALAFVVAVPLGDDVYTLVAFLAAVASATCCIVGVRRWKPDNSTAWHLLAASAWVFVVAFVVSEFETTTSPSTSVLPSSVVTGVGYLLGIIAVRSMLRNRQRVFDPTNLLDALIGMSGVAVLAWVLVVVPYLTRADATRADQFTEATFSGLAFILAVYVARLAIGPGARNKAYYLLAASVFGIFANEIVYAVELGRGQNVAGHTLLTSILTLENFVMFGAAALHPSMRDLTKPATDPTARMTRRRLFLMTTAVLTPPVVLAVRSATGLETAAIIGCWGVISIMVMIRMAGLVRARERAQELDRVLSRAAAGLVAATEVQDMYSTALSTALSLATPSVAHAAVLTTRDGVWTVAASETAPGREAPRFRAEPFRAADLGSSVAEALLGPTTSALADVVPPELLAGTHCSVAVVPMVSRNVLLGALVVSSDKLMDAQIIDAISSLGLDLALALQSAAMAEEMYRQRNERRFRSLIENSDDVVVLRDAAGRSTFITPAATRLLGYNEQELVEVRFEDLLAVEDISTYQALLASPSERQTPRELRVRDRVGNLHWFEIVVADLSHDPEIAGIVVTAREISDRKAAELRLAKSEARFRALVQHSSDVVAVMDRQGILTYVSSSVSRVLGYRVDQLMDRELLVIVHPEDQGKIGNVLRRLGTSQAPATTEVRVCGTDDQWRTLDVTLTDLSEDPSVGGIVLNAHDVTERQQLEYDLRHQALHDGLTGLPNRVLFRDRVSQALARRDDSSVAVLMIDLDDFKTINDAVGHPVGDEMLKMIAYRLRQFLRAGDTAARLGGDEFAIAIEDVRDREEVLEIARRILISVRAPVSWDGREIRADASIGIVFDTDCPNATPEIMLRNADMAMYSAKGKGKGRVAVYDESMHVGVFERLELKADLARAIELDELLLYYQPVVDLRSAKIVGFEALMRWQHHDRGMISPGSFIPLAEETGAIVPMGRWLIDKAFAQLADWQHRFPSARLLGMSVNLSPRQLEDPHIALHVRHALERNNLDPATITMELTESSLVDGGSLRQDRLAEIRAVGVNIVADDFGSGYASYAALGQLPFTGLKIDMSLVEGLGDETDTKAVAQVRSIIDFAHGTGLSVVAEGIEAGAQVTVLTAVGCTLGQGFYYSPPLPVDKAEAVLAESSLTPAV
jgi:diguanylate cyclase (GGDEF)-like protein/PAS domain S-box-containing protein